MNGVVRLFRDKYTHNAKQLQEYLVADPEKHGCKPFLIKNLHLSYLETDSGLNFQAVKNLQVEDSMNSC